MTQFPQILEVIELNCKISKDNNDPEKRKYAVQIIKALFEEVGFASEKLNQEVIVRLFEILSRTVEDYTMDKRGDIGSIVREESMTTMLHIVGVYCNSKDKHWLLSDEIVTGMVGMFLQQLN